MNKKLITVISIITVLLAIIAISLKLNQPSIEMQKEIFEAVLDTADTNPVVHQYTGTQLKNILKSNNIDVANNATIILIAADGGRGPYESIVVSDSFSNRRCKWLTKIEVK